MRISGEHHQPSTSSSALPDGVLWQSEFLCPISGRPMSDPVIVPSGLTYERNCVSAWLESGQTQCPCTGEPLLTADGSASLIPNIAIRLAIQRFCQSSGLPLPSPPSIQDAHLFVTGGLHRSVPPSPQPPSVLPSAPPLEPRLIHSATYMGPGQDPVFPFPLSSRPATLDDSGSVTYGAGVIPGRYTQRLLGPDVAEQEAAAHDLRQLTRTDRSCRSIVTSHESLLRALIELSTSPSPWAQSNAVATIVNLSLEKENKVRLVGAGVLQFLVDVLRSGCAEARGHAAAALFSLAVDEKNRNPIAINGAIPPLLCFLGKGGSDDIAAAEDAAMALYYLSLQKTNRAKMIHAGAIPILARRCRRLATGAREAFVSADDGSIRARCFMILYNLATVEEGRRALLVSDVLDDATEEIVGAQGTGPVVEHAVALMLLMVGMGNARLVDTRADSGLVLAVRRLAALGTGRTKEKAAALLNVLKEGHASELVENDGDGGGRVAPVVNISGWGGSHHDTTGF